MFLSETDASQSAYSIAPLLSLSITLEVASAKLICALDSFTENSSWLNGNQPARSLPLSETGRKVKEVLAGIRVKVVIG
jgi:hypothetical protein